MKITTRFLFEFKVGTNTYNFTIDAETSEEAKKILAEDLRKIIEQLCASSS